MDSRAKIIPGLPQDLGYTVVGAPSGGNDAFLKRFLLMNQELFENAPCHIAVHIISGLEECPEPYAQVHCHPASDEIGLIIAPEDQLEYEIILEGEVRRVKSPAAVYIPAGTYHRARAVAGSGAYVCIILDPKGPHADNVITLQNTLQGEKGKSPEPASGDGL